MIDRIANITLKNLPSSVQEGTIKESTSEPVEQNVKEIQLSNVPKKKLDDVVNALNEFVSASPTHLKFELHEKLKEYYVKIVDDTTDEVVREIPSKKLLDMYAAMNEYLGILVDKKI